MNETTGNQSHQEIPTCHIMTSEEFDHWYNSNPENLMPVRRKDDRRLPGIVTGWATSFSERYFAWRVWDGTVQREDHPTKDEIYGYWESSQGIGHIENNCAVRIIYPEGKPESEFVEWANAEASRFMDEYHSYELSDPAPDTRSLIDQLRDKIREVKS